MIMIMIFVVMEDEHDVFPDFAELDNRWEMDVESRTLMYGDEMEFPVSIEAVLDPKLMPDYACLDFGGDGRLWQLSFRASDVDKNKIKVYDVRPFASKKPTGLGVCRACGMG